MEVVDHSQALGLRRCLRQLVDFLKGGIEAAMALDPGPIASAPPAHCGTAQPCLLSVIPAPHQIPFLQHLVQDAGEGVVLDLEFLSQLLGHDFLE